MRLRLSVVGVCLILSACGTARSSDNYVNHLQPAIATTTASSKYCTLPTADALMKELVPGIPCAMSLSQYAGLPAEEGTKLVGRVELRRPSLLRRLTNEFNSLPAITGEGTIINCPNDRGGEIVAGLKYPQHEDLRLRVNLTGCPGAQRESVTRSALGSTGERLIGQLEQLVAHR
jgi:hypothetical protein